MTLSLSKASLQSPSPPPVTVQHGPHLLETTPSYTLRGETIRVHYLWELFLSIRLPEQTLEDSQRGEDIWMSAVWQIFPSVKSPKKSLIDSLWRKTLYVLHLSKVFLSVRWFEQTHKNSQRGKELWMSAVWQSVLSSWQPPTSYPDSHRREAICLLSLSKVLLSVI